MNENISGYQIWSIIRIYTFSNCKGESIQIMKQNIQDIKGLCGIDSKFKIQYILHHYVRRNASLSSSHILEYL